MILLLLLSIKVQFCNPKTFAFSSAKFVQGSYIVSARETCLVFLFVTVTCKSQTRFMLVFMSLPFYTMMELSLKFLQLH